MYLATHPLVYHLDLSHQEEDMSRAIKREMNHIKQPSKDEPEKFFILFVPLFAAAMSIRWW